jgi:hypothetical protein
MGVFDVLHGEYIRYKNATKILCEGTEPSEHVDHSCTRKAATILSRTCELLPFFVRALR